jgi:mono/diheme cytochrome c family protein
VVDETLANDSLRRWVHSHADSSANQYAPTAQNLKAARAEYNEHCAACHGLDGSGSNRFEAHFYPPIPKLTGETQQLSDAEIYFIVANGIAYSAMPGFGKKHTCGDIWRCVLWVRHLAQLTPEEKAALESDAGAASEEHEHSMEHQGER